MGDKRTLHTVPEGPMGAEEEAFEVRVERSDSGFRVSVDSLELDADVARPDQGVWSVLADGGSYEAQVSSDDGVIQVLVGGERFRFRGRQAAGVAGVATGKSGLARADVKAPMPGKVVKLLVALGDDVLAGQGVLLFEAMKMQNEIKSPLDGIVGELFVVEGQAVDAREPMFTVKA